MPDMTLNRYHLVHEEYESEYSIGTLYLDENYSFQTMMWNPLEYLEASQISFSRVASRSVG